MFNTKEDLEVTNEYPDLSETDRINLALGWRILAPVGRILGQCKSILLWAKAGGITNKQIQELPES